MKSWSQDRDHVGSSRVRRKSERSSEVLEEPTEKSRSLPEKLVGVRIGVALRGGGELVQQIKTC